MTAVAAPLSTLVPRKQMFANSSGETPARVSRVSSFSTGSDSPVNVPCEMNKSFAAMRRTSAGIMFPAESFTTSPGTNCMSGTSSSLPSRTTLAVTLIIAFSFSAAASALASCTKRSDTPRITIKAITVPARTSPVANEIVASTVGAIVSSISPYSLSAPDWHVLVAGGDCQRPNEAFSMKQHCHPCPGPNSYEQHVKEQLDYRRAVSKRRSREARSRGRPEDEDQPAAGKRAAESDRDAQR